MPSRKTPKSKKQELERKPSTNQRLRKTADQSTAQNGAKFFIVGIGASAGGFEAFTQILHALPRDINAAFVLVQHLDPKHKSSLVELLTRVSALPVEEIRAGTRVQPARVYVIPPDANVVLSKGHLMLLPRRTFGINMPVDHFLRSLAAEEENCAVGVILSGTGTDGTLGMQAIKGQGGITFAQDDKSAQFSGMPSSAVGAGCVDFILEPEAIASELVRISRHPYLRQISPQKEDPRASAPPEAEKLFLDAEREVSAIFSILRSQTGVDFGLYKHSTIRRRLLRRGGVTKTEGPGGDPKSPRGVAEEVGGPGK